MALLLWKENTGFSGSSFSKWFHAAGCSYAVGLTFEAQRYKATFRKLSMANNKEITMEINIFTLETRNLSNPEAKTI